MSDDYFCPICFNKLKEISGCGAVNYFCDNCKSLISKSKMLKEEELQTNDSQS